MRWTKCNAIGHARPNIPGVFDGALNLVDRAICTIEDFNGEIDTQGVQLGASPPWRLATYCSAFALRSAALQRMEAASKRAKYLSNLHSQLITSVRMILLPD
jgi:hypothetical protein